MAVYAKHVTSNHEIFKGRVTTIMSGASPDKMDVISRTPVPDNITLCNGCNRNVKEGYLVYLDKRRLNINQPYDYYCEECVKYYWPKCIIVKEA